MWLTSWPTDCGGDDVKLVPSLGLYIMVGGDSSGTLSGAEDILLASEVTPS